MIEPTWLPPTLVTERLVVRALNESDVPAIFRHASNPNVTQFTRWDAHGTPEDTRAFLRHTLTQYAHQIPEGMAVALRDSPWEAIGVAGCFWESQDNHCMEVGYWIAEPFWGRGYAGEAARAVVTFAFQQFEVQRMQSHCMAENAASARVLEKLGFQFEGVARSAIKLRGQFRDMRRYAVLRGEWPV